MAALTGRVQRLAMACLWRGGGRALPTASTYATTHFCGSSNQRAGLCHLSSESLGRVSIVVTLTIYTLTPAFIDHPGEEILSKCMYGEVCCEILVGERKGNMKRAEAVGTGA